jgi:hypothetical protein
MAEVRIMPDVVGPRNLVTLQPEESVRAAARLMAHKKNQCDFSGAGSSFEGNLHRA